MDTFKNFLVLGSVLVCITSYNIASSSTQCHSINKSGLISGSMGLSSCNTVITKSLEVNNSDFGKVNHDALAEIRFGKQNKNESEPSTNVSLKNNGKLIQNKNGHIHVFNSMDIQEESNILTTKYNPNHIKTEGKKTTLIKDYNIKDKDTAGFDIHGDGKDPNSGFVKFHKGSTLQLAKETQKSIEQHRRGHKYSNKEEDNSKNLYPALYLCNANSRVDISEVLPAKYKQSDSENEVQQEFKAHIVGTTDNMGNRQGTVDIFDISGNIEKDSILENAENQLDKMGNNDIICDNVKINIPSYKFQVVDKDGNKLSNISQKIIVTSLEPAINEGTEENPVYDTVNGTEKFTGMTINLVDENGKPVTEFTLGNLINIIKNSYIDNSNPEYTLLKKKGTEGEGTGIKIIPPIKNIDEIEKIFAPSANSKIINITTEETEKRVLIPEFLKSIRNSNDNNLKAIIYRKDSNTKYRTYTDFLNDQNYTLDLDKFNKNNTVPLIHFNRKYPEGDRPYIDINGYTGNILPIYVNLKGSNPRNWKMPSNEGKNQVNEIDFYGNNTKFTRFINLIEEPVNSANDPYVKKIVFDKNSYIKTGRDQNDMYNPITWEFIGSNNNINQDYKNQLYASNIDEHLSLMVLNNNNEQNMQIKLNNPNKKKNGYNSFLYSDEVFVTTKDDSTSTNCSESKIPDTTMIISDNITLRLLNKEYAENNPVSHFIPREITLGHIDGDFTIMNYNNLLDSRAKYYPTQKFIEVTRSLEKQLKNYPNEKSSTNEDTTTETLHRNKSFMRKPSVGLHLNIPTSDFPVWIKETLEENTTFHIDLTVARDNNVNKLQFYHMMEYIYDLNYDEQSNNRSKTSRSNFDSNTHLYIPLLKIQEGNVNYYYLTTFEVFPGYTRDILKNNFKNATSVRRGVARYDVIPNIYIGGQEISTKDNKIEIFFDKDNTDLPDGKYLVFALPTYSDELIGTTHDPKSQNCQDSEG